MNENAKISEAEIKQLIRLFYARVRDDVVLGPIFDSAIIHWDEHFEKLQAFWSSVMLTSGRYKGNPVAAHMKHLSAITPSMFDRWLVLWTEVTTDTLPPAIAAELQRKAMRIAESLKLAMYFRLAPAVLEPLGPIEAVS